MEIILERGRDDLAMVYAARFRGEDDLILEFVDSLSGSGDIKEKWVVVLSSQFGCPVGCKMCDTVGYFRGNPTTDELLAQADHIVYGRFPDGIVPSRKFKVQFARMGEPALNPSVIEAILEMKGRYEAPGYMPCISTMAPEGSDEFFLRLLDLNHDVFRGNFQLQFSIHSTDRIQRDYIIPMAKWDLDRIAEYGSEFFTGGRKVALNFALAPGNTIDPDLIRSLFPRDVFMLKLTPVNPTAHAVSNNMVREYIDMEDIPEMEELRTAGYDVVLSIGDPRENEILSNCGQLVALWKDGLPDPSDHQVDERRCEYEKEPSDKKMAPPVR